MKGKGKNSFIVYHDWYEIIQDYSDERLGKLFRAIFEYEINGRVETQLDPECAVVFKFVEQALDRNRAEYKIKCEQNKKNADKRHGKKK